MPWFISIWFFVGADMATQKCERLGIPFSFKAERSYNAGNVLTWFLDYCIPSLMLQ